mmetsp:Transcript_37614/g.88944  ORF Transcript_37614/g.88944 Transcript_37614/m.88944 type:complete len:313 (+) Transcript_37614:1263-2201(+)
MMERLKVVVRRLGFRLECLRGLCGLNRIHRRRPPVSFRRRLVEHHLDRVQEIAAQLRLQQAAEVVVRAVLVLVQSVVALLQLVHLAVRQTPQHARERLLVGSQTFACLEDALSEEVEAWSDAGEDRELQVTAHLLCNVVKERTVLGVLVRLHDGGARGIVGLAEDVFEHFLVASHELSGPCVIELLRQFFNVVRDGVRLIPIELTQHVNPLAIVLAEHASCLALDAPNHIFAVELCLVCLSSSSQLSVRARSQDLDKSLVVSAHARHALAQDQSVTSRLRHDPVAAESTEVRERACEKPQHALALLVHDRLQ